MEQHLFETIARAYGTPAYLFDLDALTSRLQYIRELLGNTAELCYAMKANPFLVKPMLPLVEHFEVCSPGEFAICEKAQIPASRIVLSGVYKEKEEMARVIRTYDAQITYTIESEHQYEILKEYSQQASTPLNLLFRFSSGNQFGMDEPTLIRLLQDLLAHPTLHFHGIQYYSGTQKKKFTFIEKELNELDALCHRLQQLIHHPIPVLEYGPGLYVSYFEPEEAEQEKTLLLQLRQKLQQMTFGGKIILEMGRFMVAACGYYLTSVVDIKRTGDQNYCIVDGGIHHMNYYGQNMGMKPPPLQHFPDKPLGKPEAWNICGSLCTSGDVLAKQYSLPDLAVQDILVFHKLGAYAITESLFFFLSRNLPKVFYYGRQHGLQLVRDELPTYPLHSYP